MHTSLGDLDGDGDLDLITASSFLLDGFSVFLGNGDGTFGPGSQLNTQLDQFVSHSSLGDRWRWGISTLVTSALVSNAFTIFLGNGDGTFGKASQIDTALDGGLFTAAWVISMGMGIWISLPQQQPLVPS